MKNKTPYYKAAELVASGAHNGACMAIGVSCVKDKKQPVLYRHEFSLLFCPYPEYHIRDSFRFWWEFDEEGKLARTLALLFMDLIEQEKEHV